MNTLYVHTYPLGLHIPSTDNRLYKIVAFLYLSMSY